MNLTDVGINLENIPSLRHYFGSNKSHNGEMEVKSSGGSHLLPPEEEEDDFYIYENSYFRAILIILYSIVFVLCFFGNLTVILVVTLDRRLRSVTKFCLGNLAFANWCVGIFCVYQNLSMYLIDSWIFGNFLCKMYHFTNSLSYTASILILVVICVERYLVILYPLQCRRILTTSKLKLIILCVWIISALLCAPRISYILTIKNPMMVGNEYEVICILLASIYDCYTADTIQFILLFILPLTVISFLFLRVGIFLHRRGKQSFTNNILVPNQGKPRRFSMYNRRKTIDETILLTNGSPLMSSNSTATATTMMGSSVVPGLSKINPEKIIRINFSRGRGSTSKNCCSDKFCYPTPVSKTNQPHRVALRMLIIIVLTFAVCNLPFHLRKLYQNHVPESVLDDEFSELVTQLSFLLMYANSAINPILFAFMSKSFRTCLAEVLKCNLRQKSPQDAKVFL